uniref:Large ribosomal subunit protein bL32c n=1 Tax=Lophocladia kuetzingii TaxID=675577 RepID=A0A1Z1MNZ2_9FLOR|nr:ribosomal protein L32 [Lophocladia kuetzingii]ARW67562.1 ribosomal protein L32 [Lophocladia kuetzingii]
MAVPKKKTSKSKSRIRKACWKNKAYFISQKSFALAQSVLSDKSVSFVYDKSIENEIDN